MSEQPRSIAIFDGTLSRPEFEIEARIVAGDWRLDHLEIERIVGSAAGSNVFIDAVEIDGDVVAANCGGCTPPSSFGISGIREKFVETSTKVVIRGRIVGSGNVQGCVLAAKLYGVDGAPDDIIECAKKAVAALNAKKP